jgi:hypothetical protein
MGREDIIRMAREAGFRDTTTPVVALGVSWEQVQRFAALVAAAEREACARVCEDIDTEYEGEDVLATWCAAAIRARGNK